MKFNYFFAFFSIFLILFPVGNVHATDAGNSTSINKPVVKWMKKVSDWGEGSDTNIQASQHYVLYDGYGGTKVLKSEDGEEVWSGYLSSPYLHNDRIYAFNASGLSSYKVNGELVWHIPYGVYGFLGGRITFTHAGILLWNGELAVCSLISYDGRVLMKKILKEDGDGNIVWVTSPPALWNNTIYWEVYNYRQNKTVLYAININGTILWNFTEFEKNEYVTQIYVDKKGSIYMLSRFVWIYDVKHKLIYRIYSLNEKGHLNRKLTMKYYDIPAETSFFKMINSTIYLVNAYPLNINMQKIDIREGRVTEEKNITGVGFLPSSIEREEIIDLDSSMNIYLIYRGNLYSYSWNGSLRWKISVGDAITRFALQNDSIYVLTEHGYIYALRVQPEFKTDIYSIIILSGIFIGLLILGFWKQEKMK